MDVQPELFANAALPSATPLPSSLLIRVAQKDRLTKAQKTFNRLVREIESLRLRIELETDRWNGWIKVYASELHPLELRLATARKSVVRSLLPFLEKQHKLGHRKQSQLKDLIIEQIEAIQDAEGELKDPDLQTVLEEFRNDPRRKSADKAFEAMRNDMGEYLKTMGVDVDLSAFRPDMTPEDLSRTLAEIELKAEEVEQAKAPPENARPKSKAERTREEREKAAEALQTRNVTTLYRQLAKLLHPDLEQDPARRLEKEQAMKELTLAYKANDLHSLLRLEMAWITREQADTARLADDKLALYNAVLREQIEELHESLRSVGLHPRFAPLFRYLPPYEENPRFDPQAERIELTKALKSMERTITRLQGPRGREEVIALLHDFDFGL